MQCSNCGSPVTEATRFCAGCGDALPAAQGREAGQHSAVLPDPAELAVLKELHDKKRQIAIEMRAILEFTKQSGASEADQSRYAELRRQWAEVDFEVTKRMSALTERKAVERRKGASRGKERRKRATEIRQQDRRSGEDRRVDDRRAGDDRRDPFPGDLPTQPMPKIDDPPSEA